MPKLLSPLVSEWASTAFVTSFKVGTSLPSAGMLLSVKRLECLLTVRRNDAYLIFRTRISFSYIQVLAPNNVFPKKSNQS